MRRPRRKITQPNPTVAFRLDRSAAQEQHARVMGYHLRAKAAAGPRAEGRATRGAWMPRAAVGSGYRYYSPALGRWVNRDPIGEAGGVSLYRLLRNDPVTRLDWLGLRDVHGTLELVYRDKSGNLRSLTASTDVNEIGIEYTAPPGSAGLISFDLDAAEMTSPAYRRHGQGEWCTVRIRLSIQLSSRLQGYGEAYAAPSQHTRVHYRRHVHQGRSGGSDMMIEPYSRQLDAYVARAHERGHARGYIEMLFAHGMRRKLYDALDFGRVMQLSAAEDRDRLARYVRDVIFRVEREVGPQIHMRAADVATEAVFGRAGWTRVELVDNDRYDVRWDYLP